jgi:hypothetical protein
MIKEQTEPYQRKAKAQRRKNRKMYTKARGHKNPKKTGKPFVNPASPTGVSSPPMGEEVDYPSWTIEENPGYELTQRELHANLNKHLEEQEEAEASQKEPSQQYEIDLRVKILKDVTTRGVVESEIRAIPGVTIVASHGDPRAKFYSTGMREDYLFAVVTVRFYPRQSAVGMVPPEVYKNHLLKRIASIKVGGTRALALGIGAHGGVKILSLLRKA